MPNLVINTGSILALAAGTGNLQILARNYDRVVVPFQVAQEIRAVDASSLGFEALELDQFVEENSEPIKLETMLASSLDPGEASVIQTALQENIDTVCIDEAVGRRVARLNGLKLTGSLGVLIKAKKNGDIKSVGKCLENMKSRGIWISEHLYRAALDLAGEQAEDSSS